MYEDPLIQHRIGVGSSRAADEVMKSDSPIAQVLRRGTRFSSRRTLVQFHRASDGRSFPETRARQAKLGVHKIANE